MSNLLADMTAGGALLTSPMHVVHRGRLVAGDLAFTVADVEAALRWLQELTDMSNRRAHLRGEGSWTARSGSEQYGLLALEAGSLGESWVISAYLDGPGAQEALFLAPSAAALVYERLLWSVGR